jgi:putative ABC transport system permease protein
MIRRVFGSLRSLLAGRRVDRELDEEIRFHVERQTEENLRRGLAPEAARTEALRRFGGVDKFKEECREADRAVLFETILLDVRYGLRSLRKNPGYAAAAVLTLALGIGANTAIFSVVHGVLLQSLPYGGGERLVRIEVNAPGAGIQDGAFSPLEIADLQNLSRSLEGVAEYHSMWFVLLGRPEPERVQTGVVSAHFFDTMGVKPILGRTFAEGEDGHGAEAVLVLSHQYWMRSFGGDPRVVGQVFTMNDRPHTVIGVLPPIPGYPDENDVYMPIHACPFRSDPRVENNRDSGMLRAFARLKEGAPFEGAEKDLSDLAARMAQDHPKSYPASIRLSLRPVSLREELTRQARPTFLLLSATVGLVLLIACANVANLTLSRLVRREREMALRSALGAGRGRLARQLLTESVVVAVLGGLLGLAVAAAGRQLLVHFAARFTPRASEIAIDGPVLLFTLGVSLVAGLGLGLIPALSSRRSLVSALQDGRDPAASAPGRLRMRNFLIVAQVAISFVLLAGAGLMLRTLWKLRQIDPGFKSERVLTSRLDLNFTRYREREKQLDFNERLLAKLSSEPGVVSVALAGRFPLAEGGPSSGRYRLEGHPPVAEEALPRADFQRVSADYFKTIGVPLLRGRALTGADRTNAPRVAVINKTMASHVFPGEDPIGRRIGVNGDAPGEIDWLTIVGVSGDVRQYGLANPPVDQVYLSLLQYPGLSTACLVRTSAEPMTLTRTVRDAVHSIGPEQPVDRFRTLEELHTSALDMPRLTAVLLAAFAGLALIITATGIAGVIGFTVGQRRQEFGIRMALGALPGAVVGMVLRQGMRLVVLGLAIGLASAFALSRLFASLLYETTPSDPPTYLAVALVLGLVAAVACFVPARRATSVDPMVALRNA